MNLPDSSPRGFFGGIGVGWDNQNYVIFYYANACAVEQRGVFSSSTTAWSPFPCLWEGYSINQNLKKRRQNAAVYLRYFFFFRLMICLRSSKYPSILPDQYSFIRRFAFLLFWIFPCIYLRCFPSTRPTKTYSMKNRLKIEVSELSSSSYMRIIFFQRYLSSGKKR